MTKSGSYFILFFLNFTLLLDSYEALPSVIFWTSRGYRCLPFFPPVRVLASLLYRIGFSAPTFQRITLVNLLQFLIDASSLSSRCSPPTKNIYQVTYQIYFVSFMCSAQFFTIFFARVGALAWVSASVRVGVKARVGLGRRPLVIRKKNSVTLRRADPNEHKKMTGIVTKKRDVFAKRAICQEPGL